MTSNKVLASPLLCFIKLAQVPRPGPSHLISLYPLFLLYLFSPSVRSCCSACADHVQFCSQPTDCCMLSTPSNPFSSSWDSSCTLPPIYPGQGFRKYSILSRLLDALNSSLHSARLLSNQSAGFLTSWVPWGPFQMTAEHMCCWSSNSTSL